MADVVFVQIFDHAYDLFANQVYILVIQELFLLENGLHHFLMLILVII